MFVVSRRLDESNVLIKTYILAIEGSSDGIQGNGNQEYQRSDGAVEGGDSEGGCSYDREDEGMTEAFWI